MHANDKLLLHYRWSLQWQAIVPDQLESQLDISHATTTRDYCGCLHWDIDAEILYCAALMWTDSLRCLCSFCKWRLVFSQAVEWLGELLDALLKTHIRLGDDSQETKVLLEKHKKFVDVAQVFDAQLYRMLIKTESY